MRKKETDGKERQTGTPVIDSADLRVPHATHVPDVPVRAPGKRSGLARPAACDGLRPDGVRRLSVARLRPSSGPFPSLPDGMPTRGGAS